MQRSFIGLTLAAVIALGPAWTHADDQQVAQQIAVNLRDSGQMEGYRVAVKFADGVALLSGRVSDKGQKQIAERLARGTDGVKHVVNDLTVESAGAIRQPRGVLNKSLNRARRTSFEQPATSQNYAARMAASQTTAPVRRTALNQPTPATGGATVVTGEPIPVYMGSGGVNPAAYDHAHMPAHAWPSYAAYPNYAGVTYPRQYSATAWPFIGPFYPYPQVPLGWRKVTLEWDDGWWMLDFKDH